MLLIQIIIIIFLAKTVGTIFRKFGQPFVMGEIFVGLLLGPSLLGAFFPNFSFWLFPENSIHNLDLLSHIGIILFMFMIGMELDARLLQNKIKSAFGIGFSSVIVPFILGFILSFFLFPINQLDISFIKFGLFIGVAMSITAFPVLARIIQEKRLSKTPLGILAITSAAINDVIGWFLLAFVITLVSTHSCLKWGLSIGYTFFYLGVMFFIIKPFLKRISDIYHTHENFNKTIVTFIFLMLLSSAYITQLIGIHAIFGAFLAGVLMPQNQAFKKIFIEKIEDISLVILLPLFFICIGLRTQISLISGFADWMIFISIFLVAVIGKFGGSAVMARYQGQSIRNALSIGVLMNTRGLMELVVLNIGLELGLLSEKLFTMLVLMAFFTTFMTGPFLNLISYYANKFKKSVDISDPKTTYEILVSFAQASTGKMLLKLAQQMTRFATDSLHIKALHITPNSELSSQHILLFEHEIFYPIKKLAKKLGMNLKTQYTVTQEVQKEILQTCEDDHTNLLLVGAARSLFSKNEVGGLNKYLLEHSLCHMGIFINKNFVELHHLVFLIHDYEDLSLFKLAAQFFNHSELHWSVVLLDHQQKKHLKIMTFLQEIPHQLNATFEQIDIIPACDLMVLSLKSWEKIESQKSQDELPENTSILIIKMETSKE